MKWANVLHFYQPYEQKKFIVNAIAGQTYNPVIDGILEANHGKVTINLTGSLLELLDAYGHHKLIDKFKEAGRRGLVEYVGTSKYHSILPMLPPDEARRQILINNETNKHFLGDAYNPKGIFLPEQAYSPALAPLLEELGFEYVIADELAYDGRIDHIDYSKTYKVEGTNLNIFFREHRLSDTLMSASAQSIDQLKAAMGSAINENRYIVTGMDGETYGHHRVGLERLLIAAINDPELEMVTFSELLKAFPEQESVPTVACTWASNEQDLLDGIPYITWNDPENEIHKLQWELLNLAVTEMNKLPENDPSFADLRKKLDPAMASDQFFWSAARPWWMIEYIEGGAFRLVDVIQHLPTTGPTTSEYAQSLYHHIMGLAYDWQRNGKLDRHAKERETIVRIPFKERTFEQGGEGEATWNAFIDMMKELELKAVKKRDYEAAELWRDAMYKLETKTDVYDAFHVIDILRTKIPHDKVEATLERYRSDYNRIRGGQSEQRSH